MYNFTKMQAIGNDFIIIDLNANKDIENKYVFAKKICNRHFSVGADGLILLKDTKNADKEIEIFNCDGSEAMMCGNGVRCVCKYLVDTASSKSGTITLKTKSGIKEINYSYENEFIATVNIGRPSISIQNIGLRTDKEVFFNEPITLCSREYKVTCVSVGNVHTIVLVNNIDILPIEDMAKEILENLHFFNGTNIEFVEIISPKELKIRVFERGCGETLGCGTGAAASFYTAFKLKKVLNEAIVNLPGGNLTVRFDENLDNLFLTGTAYTVFSGSIDI